MKSYRKELWFETPERRAFLNITSQVEVAEGERRSRGPRAHQRYAYHRLGFH